MIRSLRASRRAPGARGPRPRRDRALASGSAPGCCGARRCSRGPGSRAARPSAIRAEDPLGHVGDAGVARPDRPGQCSGARGANSTAKRHAAVRADSILKRMISSSWRPPIRSRSPIQGETSARSCSTVAISAASTSLIRSKSRRRSRIDPPGAVSAAAIPRSRLMWALIPRSRCWTMSGRWSWSPRSASCQDRVGGAAVEERRRR